MFTNKTAQFKNINIEINEFQRHTKFTLEILSAHFHRLFENVVLLSLRILMPFEKINASLFDQLHCLYK